MKSAAPLGEDPGEAEIADPLYARIFERARPCLQTRDNERHTRIAYGYVLRLLEAGGAPDVAIPAILLHDIGWSRVPDALHLAAIGPKATNPEIRDIHEREGARMAEQILAELGYPEEQARRIVHIVAGHDTRPGCDSLEEAIVRDADKLYRLSPIGFRVTIGWYGVDPLVHIGWLEKRIPSWFITELGTRLAREEVAARRLEFRNRPEPDLHR